MRNLDVRLVAAACLGAVVVGCTAKEPTVELVTPLWHQALFHDETLAATVDNEGHVAAVEFLVDGTVVATVSGSPYEVTFDTTGLEDGEYPFSARAILEGGGTAESTTVTASLANSLRTDDRLIVDLDLARISRFEFVDYGITWMTEPETLPARYQSRMDGEIHGSTALLPFYLVMGSLTETEQEAIRARVTEHFGLPWRDDSPQAAD